MRLRAVTLVSPLIAAASFAALLVGCSAPPGEQARGDTSSAQSSATIPVLPWAGGTGALSPWGGGDPTRWRPEAIIANASSQALNEAWATQGITDATVAIPTKMISSNFFEFGDGQSNAAPSFEFWRGQSRPPIIATLMHFGNSAPKVMFRFDRSLPYVGTTFELQYATNGQRPLTSVTLNATRTSQGDAIAEWAPTSDLGWDSLLSGAVVLVHPTGWNDWFPIWFRMPVKSINALHASQLRYSDGRSIIDREGVTSKNNSDGSTPFQRLMSHSFVASYNGRAGNASPFVPNDIHAIFPFNRQQFVTGIGRGWTWVADERPGGFKDMYTCFERRRAVDEANAPNGGVPSGGGWHQINDTQETILNDLEAGPLVVGSAMGNPWLESTLPSGRYAYNLTDVITVRFLQPGEGFITPKGQWSTDGNGNWYDQSNYHWYFFQQAQESCTEELVSPAGSPAVGFNL